MQQKNLSRLSIAISLTAQTSSIIEVYFYMYTMTTCHESSSRMVHSVTISECLDVVSLGRVL